MKVQEIRRIRLTQLLAEYSGPDREFADAIGQSPSFVSQLKNGSRDMGESVARGMEKSLSLPPYSLDTLEENPNLEGVLAGYFETLSEEDRTTLVEYAQFLASKASKPAR